MSKISTIEVQFFDGCPNVTRAFDLVKKYQHEHPEVNLNFTQVGNNDQAAAIGFRGSPTILIDGKDLFQQTIPDQPSLACRFYPEGLPDYNTFVKMIHKL